MKTGTLYGVGVGPGDPELMTLKAVRTIKECGCIAAPETGGEKTLALSIAAGAVDLSGKDIITLRFLMTRDAREQRRSHEEIADTLEARLRSGTDVALLNLGDVSIYSTFAYIMDILKARGFEVRMIPGVPSFCAVAAALGTGLTEMNLPLHIIPGGDEDLDGALSLRGGKVIMKTGRSMAKVREALIRRGLADKTMLVQNCGLPNERVCKSLEEASDDISYFTTMIIRE